MANHRIFTAFQSPDPFAPYKRVVWAGIYAVLCYLPRANPHV